MTDPFEKEVKTPSRTTGPEDPFRKDPNGYVEGSYAAAHPIVQDRLGELDRLLEDQRYKIKNGESGSFGMNADDANMRRDLLRRIETGLALDKERPGQGMDIDSALAALNAASKTNRLQNVTTNSAPVAMLAKRLGLPTEIPSGRRGNETERFKLSSVWSGVNAETGKQALTLDQIMHPEKYREPVRPLSRYLNSPQGVFDTESGSYVDVAWRKSGGVVSPVPEDVPVSSFKERRDFSKELLNRYLLDPVSDTKGTLYDYYAQAYDKTGKLLPGSVVNQGLERLMRQLNDEAGRLGEDAPFKFFKPVVPMRNPGALVEMGDAASSAAAGLPEEFVRSALGYVPQTARQQASRSTGRSAPAASKPDPESGAKKTPQEMDDADVIDVMQKANPNMSREAIETKARELGYIK